MKKAYTWFSLIEILVGILIVSIVMVAAFQTLSAVGVWKTKIIEKTKVEKQAYFAGEKFFEMIKKWWTIDYEEYWNRSSYHTGYSSGHFDRVSGFWNFWKDGILWDTVYGWRQYNCLSKDGVSMWNAWCLRDFNASFDLWSTHNDYSWDPQRYTQYLRQFIDRNSDADADGWNEDGDAAGSIIDDDDDLHIGIWPQAFTWGSTDVGELYLINAEWDVRTFFRWNVSVDTDAPPSETCDVTTNPEKPVWNACLGTIEFLKLKWEDYWYNHSGALDTWDGSQWDGIIDTWNIHPDFLTGTTDIVASSVSYDYWQPVFPNSIHVSDVEFYLYPNKAAEYSWRDTDASLEVSPYLQLKLTLQPSWKEKRKIRWATPSVDIVTTIQLSDLDFR